MNKRIVIAFVALILGACGKEPGKEFMGSYSYRMSGSIDMVAEPLAEGETSVAPDSFTITLANQMGSLDIVTLDADKETLFVSLRPLNGSIMSFEAKVADGLLVLSSRDVRLKGSSGGLESGWYDVTLGGSAKMLSNLLHINFEASGEMEYLDRRYSVSGSDIECVGTIN